MWCTKLNTTTNASNLDETIQVRGCLGRLLVPGRSRKRRREKLAAQAAAPPVCKAKPSVVVSPSPHCQENHQEVKENTAPTEHHRSNKGTTGARSTRPRNKSKQSTLKGQLRLGFHVNGNIIVLQVIEAKKIKMKTAFTTGDCFFASIELVSDDGETKKQVTKNVFDKNPVFNEEFALRIRNENSSSRLVISLYKLSPTGYKEVIGCMSFGAHNVLKKSKSSADTYYLLNRVLGMRKHLRISQVRHLNALADLTGVSSLSTVTNQRRRSSSHGIHRNNSSASMSPTPSEIMADDDLYDTSFQAETTHRTMLRQVSICNPSRDHGNFNPLNSTEKSRTVIPSGGQGSARPVSELDHCSLSTISLHDLTETAPLQALNKHSMMQSMLNHSTAATCSTRCTDSESSLKLSDFGATRTTILQSTRLESKQANNPAYSDTEELYLQLINAEDKFVAVMHQGVQRFSRPLRHVLLSQQEHNILFQNVEKLLTISEFHLKRLGDAWITSRGKPCSIGDIYKAQIAVLCEAYITYFRGISAAEQLLTSLLNRSQFITFLSQEDSSVRLDSFLQAPQVHLETLVSIIDKMIIAAARRREPGFNSLIHIQKALTTCWDQCLEQTIETDSSNSDHITESGDNEGLELNHPSSDSGPSAVLRTHSQVQDRRIPTSGPVNACNLDADVAKLQKRLLFGSGVEPFEVAIRGRHIVFSGELDFVSDWKWIKAWIVLMNDSIVITQRDAAGRETAICDLIMLKDVLSTEFECLHPGEFLLTVRNDSCENAWSHMRSVTFRSLEPKMKYTWRQLLEQRIKACQDTRYSHCN